MNWGNKIVLAFLCFVVFICGMVIHIFNQDFDLVAEDYYAREINYEQKLVKLANAEATGRSVHIKQETSHILLEFPDNSAKGTIEFYHPSRELFDKTYKIDLKEGIQRITKEDLVPGNYRINITWEAEGDDFLQESKIFVR